MATSKTDAMRLDRQSLGADQVRRVRRARRTAAVIGVIAFVVFVFSIAQMLWLQHHPQIHQQAIDSIMQ